MPFNSDIADVRYIGHKGISQSCIDAVRELLQFGVRIDRAMIVSAERTHCLLLNACDQGLIAVKSGFRSGYPGEGPAALAHVLCLLQAFGVEIDECAVSNSILSRLDASALTAKDLATIESSEPIRPVRWHDYVYAAGMRQPTKEDVLRSFRPIMPWAILDRRLDDLAAKFMEDPDGSVLRGFRRLEETVRSRLGSEGSGTRVFSAAFSGDKSELTWEGIDPGEHNGRAQLFIGAFQAFRNPLAHRESQSDSAALLGQFLILNELFKLEASARRRPEQ